MSSEHSTKPVAKGRSSNVQFAVWKHTSEQDGQPVNFYKATFENRYNAGDTWKTTKSFSSYDLVNLMKAAALAHTAIAELRRADKNAAEDQPAVEGEMVEEMAF